MICNRCGTQSDNGSHTCPKCGAPLRQSAGSADAYAIRQGKVRSYVPPVSPSDTAQQGASQPWYYDQYGRREGTKDPLEASQYISRHEAIRKIQRKTRHRPVNHALVMAILLFLAVAAVAALLIMAIRTPEGNLYLMRFAHGDAERQELVITVIGDENAAEALWTMANEQLDQGYIGNAISLFEEAYDLYPDMRDLYNRLMTLCDAYEAAGRYADAENMYIRLYTTVDPANPLAYRSEIALMLSQDRVFEATYLMSVAYQQTGQLSFKSERESRVPLAPTASMSSGRYMLAREVELNSSQDYDIYYLLDDTDSELPEAGKLYTRPIHLSEGAHTLRAVCVSSILVSDEINISYTIYYPTPDAPKSRLAPGEYNTNKRIYLYYPKNENSTPQKIEAIYYTIDGTAPNENSPVYTDEGFMIYGGRVTVRAVAINEYGKVSNELVAVYRINQPYKNFFRDTDDQFGKFTVGVTTYNQFIKLYGSGKEKDIRDKGLKGKEAIQVEYDWGTASFSVASQKLYDVTVKYASMAGPRGTRVSMTAADVMKAFRDVGQVANAKGNRSLYYDSYTGTGYYYRDSDQASHIEYVYWREDKGTTTLTYTCSEGAVTRIRMRIEGGDL